MWFLTEYEPFPVDPVKMPDNTGVGKYSAFIWAPDWRGAERLAARRRIGEIVIGASARKASAAPYRLPSMMLKAKMTPKQKMQFLHGVCFLSFLAQRALGVSAFDILGDRGLMHEAIHAMEHGRPARKELAQALATVERKIPGYWPGTGE